MRYMENNIPEKLYIEAQIYAEHIINALDCIGEVQAMHQVFKNGQHEDILKTAPHYFITARQAMVYRYQIEVAKLFDSRRDSLDFSRFMKSINSGNYIPQSLSDRFKERDSESKECLKAIKNRRNKILAHADVAHAKDIVTYQKEQTFELEKVQALLFTMLEVCNTLIITYSKTPADMYSYANNDDFLRLFGLETSADKTLNLYLGKRK